MQSLHTAAALHLRHELRLAPRLQQAVKLLQMSTVEFSMLLQGALASNPFLEAPGEAAWQAAGQEVVVEAGPDPLPLSGSELQLDIAPASEPPPAEAAARVREPHARAGTGNPTDWIHASMTMKEHLLRELGAYTLSAHDSLLAQHIIDALDEDGYLRAPLEDLAAAGLFERRPKEGEWRAALRLVQHLAQPGLAARDLRECLSLQLQARPACPVRDMAQAIVQDHLHLLARKDYGALQRALGACAAHVHAACDLVRSLDPKPGYRYDSAAPQYVVPDVYVVRGTDRWLIAPNRQARVTPRLNGSYAQMLRALPGHQRGELPRELDEARWLIRNAAHRYSTIERVAAEIVTRQQRFFAEGERGLQSLLLKEVADALQMHESTISRAVANKYMMTPQGLQPFQRFFSRALPQGGGKEHATAAVRARVKALIEAESPDRPLSDVRICGLLADEGIVVARRTISKYRAQLNLPPAELRRQA
ncbi:RNA polymerase factor sigma-54 [Orrella sp. JC864]|uniref:RNA polymerase factor sigma-54 n=1 Tax=Orrella sp. JC864 TaxID=3120298 RepID=UPI0012BB4F89